MRTVESIGIVGAGMAGLSCAHRLAAAGIDPVLLDKGRGIGGRIATRRTETGFQFDHGAQYVTARGASFVALIAEMQRAGSAGNWDDGSGEERIVGVPGMNGLAKHLGAAFEIRQRIEATGVFRADGAWTVETATGHFRFRTLVVTAPAPQAARLLGADDPLRPALSSVQMAPCLTLMSALSPDQPAPFRSRHDADDALVWIAQNNTKPGRPDMVSWVAQAGPDWSRENLEDGPDQIARSMVALLCDRLGADPAAVQHAAAHRWRFARTTVPLGQPFLEDETGTLFLGGDWCLGARVEAAWTSGTAIAEAILAAA